MAVTDPDLDSQISVNSPGAGLNMGVLTTLRALITNGVTDIRALVNAAGSITTAMLAAQAVTSAKLAGGFAKHAVVAGGAAGNFTVTGILTTDELNEVIYYVGAGVAVTDVSDLTSEFTITASNTINNTGGTASTGGKLLVRYTRRT